MLHVPETEEDLRGFEVQVRFPVPVHVWVISSCVKMASWNWKDWDMWRCFQGIGREDLRWWCARIDVTNQLPSRKFYRDPCCRIHFVANLWCYHCCNWFPSFLEFMKLILVHRLKQKSRAEGGTSPGDFGVCWFLSSTSNASSQEVH